MKDYVFEITSIDEDGTSTSIVIIEAPKGTKKDAISKAIKEMHDYLFEQEEVDGLCYGIGDENVLLDRVCKEHGWKWHPLKFAGSIALVY